MIRLFLSTAIISLGIAGAFYFATAHRLPTAAPNAVMAIAENSNSVSSQPLNEILSLDSTGTEEAPKPDQKNDLSLDNNLTQLLSGQFVQTLLEKNPAGPENIDGKQWLNAVQPEDFAENSIKTIGNSIDLKELEPDINDNDLKILESGDKTALINYFWAFYNIVQKSSANLPQNLLDDSANPSLEAIQRIINIYNNALTQFYLLPVPRSALEIHKKEMGFLLTKKNIFEKILNYQSDPIMMLMAVNQLKSIDAGFIDFNKELEAFIKTVL